MKYGELNLGQIEAIVNKLGGMDGVRRFLSDELEVKEAEHHWKIWKTINCGTGLKSADDFRESIKKNGMKISDWANDILGKPTFTTAAQEIELDLVKVTVTVRELGFKSGARRDQIYARAKGLGLELCSSEVGPQLRLQYPDQPNNEWILIAMEPITDSNGVLRVFSVERGVSGLWLNGHYGFPNGFWGPDSQWVFLRPRK